MLEPVTHVRLVDLTLVEIEIRHRPGPLFIVALDSLDITNVWFLVYFEDHHMLVDLAHQEVIDVVDVVHSLELQHAHLTEAARVVGLVGVGVECANAKGAVVEELAEEAADGRAAAVYHSLLRSRWVLLAVGHVYLQISCIAFPSR